MYNVLYYPRGFDNSPKSEMVLPLPIGAQTVSIDENNSRGSKSCEIVHFNVSFAVKSLIALIFRFIPMCLPPAMSHLLIKIISIHISLKYIIATIVILRGSRHININPTIYIYIYIRNGLVESPIAPKFK